MLETVNDSRKKGRNLLLAMFAIGFASVGAAYVLFFAAREGGVWGTTNYGTFVTPPVTVAELTLSDDRGRQLTEGGTWWLWVVSPGECGSACAQAVHQLRQLHVLLNKDADRVQRALVTPPDATPAVLDEYPRLEHLTGDLARLDEGIYIVDPIGNLVLHYPLEDAGKPVLEDIKKLLKVSQIG